MLWKIPISQCSQKGKDVKCWQVGVICIRSTNFYAVQIHIKCSRLQSYYCM